MIITGISTLTCTIFSRFSLANSTKHRLNLGISLRLRQWQGDILLRLLRGWAKGQGVKKHQVPKGFSGCKTPLGSFKRASWIISGEWLCERKQIFFVERHLRIWSMLLFCCDSRLVVSLDCDFAMALKSKPQTCVLKCFKNEVFECDWWKVFFGTLWDVFSVMSYSWVRIKIVSADH